MYTVYTYIHMFVYVCFFWIRGVVYISSKSSLTKCTKNRWSCAPAPRRLMPFTARTVMQGTQHLVEAYGCTEAFRWLLGQEKRKKNTNWIDILDDIFGWICHWQRDISIYFHWHINLSLTKVIYLQWHFAIAPSYLHCLNTPWVICRISCVSCSKQVLILMDVLICAIHPTISFRTCFISPHI